MGRNCFGDFEWNFTEEERERRVRGRECECEEGVV